MSSIQARHSRGCALARPWTTFADATKERGCTCRPLYHVVTRHEGKLIREPVGHVRQNASRALNKTRVREDEDDYQPVKNITFSRWADEWHAALRRPKENTKRSYVSTIDYGKRAFGDKLVRKLSAADVDRFLDLMEHRSPSTQAKHLRVLHACLQVAVRRGYAARNPVRLLEPAQRPRPTRKKAAYFTDVELARLWPELPGAMPAAVYAYLSKAAVTTGARLGELFALEWPDVRLLEKELCIARGYTQGVGINTPKDNEERIVDLTPAAEAIFEEWFQVSGCPSGGLVFPDYDGGYLVGSTVTRGILYPAMERAGIPRVGERGYRRDFHSFRHTFARIALEHGAEMTWVQRQLGHSSITVTIDRYGHWERRAEKVQAARLAGAFAI